MTDEHSKHPHEYRYKIVSKAGMETNSGWFNSADDAKHWLEGNRQPGIQYFWQERVGYCGICEPRADHSIDESADAE